MKALQVGRDETDAPLGPDAFPPSIVKTLVAEFSPPGGVVFDPFAGHGTVLLIAEELGRVPLGLEINAERVAEAGWRLRDPSALIQADARTLRSLGLPKLDLVLTSPPYMTRSNHPEDPMSGYSMKGSSYERYIGEMTTVLLDAARLLKRSGYLLVAVADLLIGAEVTPIARDTVEALRLKGLVPEQEIEIEWEAPSEPGERDVVLVYRPN